jgi:hypothetical protein
MAYQITATRPGRDGTATFLSSGGIPGRSVGRQMMRARRLRKRKKPSLEAIVRRARHHLPAAWILLLRTGDSERAWDSEGWGGPLFKSSSRLWAEGASAGSGE